MLSDISGSIIIAQTPFDDRGAVDFVSIDSLTDFYLGHGANGFVVLGVSGEGGKLTSQEALDVSSRFIKRAGEKSSNCRSKQSQFGSATGPREGSNGSWSFGRHDRSALGHTDGSGTVQLLCGRV